MTNTHVRSLAVYGTSLFAGTDPGGFFLSTDKGTSWRSVDTGLPTVIVMNQDAASPPINAFATSGTDLFAGTADGVLKRALPEMITTVETSEDRGLPKRFALDQNYPNPFNPFTTIKYALPQKLNVTLAVYNTLGQLVTTLVNGEEQAGNHEVKFDGSTLASGVYLYRIHAGSFVQTRKLLLIR